MMPNAYQQYKQQSVTTMTPGDLLIKLFDEFIAEANRGILLSNEGRPTESGKCLLKCRKILAALNNSLNDKYEISHSLEMLYVFFDETIAKAVVSSDMSTIPEILQMVTELRNTFSAADKSLRMGGGASRAPGLRISG